MVLHGGIAKKRWLIARTKRWEETKSARWKSGGKGFAANFEHKAGRGQDSEMRTCRKLFRKTKQVDWILNTRRGKAKSVRWEQAESYFASWLILCFVILANNNNDDDGSPVALFVLSTAAPWQRPSQVTVIGSGRLDKSPRCTFDPTLEILYNTKIRVAKM